LSVSNSRERETTIRLITTSLVAFAILGSWCAAWAQPSAQTNNILRRVYLFRGIAGVVFSRGMDHLAELLEQAGVTARVDSFLACQDVARQAIAEYQREPAPVAVIGHSAGAACALSFAQTLSTENIPLNLVVTFDPSRILPRELPNNIERFITVYKSNDVLGGGAIQPGKNFRGHFASYNLSQHREIIHINIEKMATAQAEVVSKVLQLGMIPAGGFGEPVPIWLNVPADQKLQLWDSGMAISAHSGDTLVSIAAAYQVPVWSLKQINELSDTASLTAGQRLVVPRNLQPLQSPTP
jgi:hypothetical protein